MRKLIAGIHRFQKQYWSENRELYRRLAEHRTVSGGALHHLLRLPGRSVDDHPRATRGPLHPSEHRELRPSVLGGSSWTLRGWRRRWSTRWSTSKCGDIIVCGHSDCGAMKALYKERSEIRRHSPHRQVAGARGPDDGGRCGELPGAVARGTVRGHRRGERPPPDGEPADVPGRPESGAGRAPPRPRLVLRDRHRDDLPVLPGKGAVRADRGRERSEDGGVPGRKGFDGRGPRPGEGVLRGAVAAGGGKFPRERARDADARGPRRRAGERARGGGQRGAWDPPGSPGGGDLPRRPGGPRGRSSTTSSWSTSSRPAPAPPRT